MDSYESGEWASIPALMDEIQRYGAHAVGTYAAAGEAAQVQIRLSLEDLEGIQQQARQAGISYQELIALIVHRFVAGW